MSTPKQPAGASDAYKNAHRTATQSQLTQSGRPLPPVPVPGQRQNAGGFSGHLTRDFTYANEVVVAGPSRLPATHNVGGAEPRSHFSNSTQASGEVEPSSRFSGHTDSSGEEEPRSRFSGHTESSEEEEQLPSRFSGHTEGSSDGNMSPSDRPISHVILQHVITGGLNSFIPGPSKTPIQPGSYSSNNYSRRT